MKFALRLFVVALLPLGLIADDQRPIAGQSVFDALTLSADGSRRSMPYPFSQLLQHLQLRSGFARDQDPFARILIPRGRSLQREAASPDYYASPRIIIALDRESPIDIPVKNRLFLGYQERAEAIEVISYNETAGRFEFQVVEDYGEGKTPRVTSASRELCMSCHQNGATIFARPLWRESSFNRDVAARIAEHHDRYLGIGTSPLDADADRIDFATDQAGMFDAYQRVWQQGCPDDSCRAMLFLASVQRAIEPEPRPVYRWTPLEKELLAILQPSWREQWPEGMPILGADIPDLASSVDTEEIPPSASPLTPRPPADYWSARTGLLRSLDGLADQFLPGEGLNGLRRATASGAVDAGRISAAVRGLQQNPAGSGLFEARPIAGSSLMQALIGEIEVNQ